MRWLKCVLLLGLSVWASGSLNAADARVSKVLPQFLDLEGRHTLYPSLYERDYYQNYLRKNPELRSGLRFAIDWQASHAKSRNLRLKIEARGSKMPTPITLEQPVRKPSWFGNWDSLALLGDDYRKFGELIAWRATLWEGDRIVAERRSFLW